MEIKVKQQNERKVFPGLYRVVKKSDNHGISKNLYHFYEEAQPQHAFQVVIEKPYLHKDCFEFKTPTIVPALTFLSQII
jgi:hypothetical protein